MKGFFKFIVCAVVVGMLGSVGYYGVNLFVGNTVVGEKNVSDKNPTNEVQASVFSAPKTVTRSAVSVMGASDGVSQVAAAVLPSIVQISIKSSETINDFWGRAYEQEQSGSGSGVIVGQSQSEIYIVTNAHVVEGSTEVGIQFNDETKAKAVLKGTDSIADLAVVSVKVSDLSQETISKIRVAQFGSSEEAKVGQQVIAIGNALGYGTSVTVGYLSAKEREVAFEDGTRILLQTDAAINPGNSGGALVDSSGKMIGINCGGVVSVDVEGINYAIPISEAIPIINQLMTEEPKPESERVYLGITGNEVSPQASEYYNMPEGIYINEVTPDSPADIAGLKAGDIITGVEGRSIMNTTQLQEQLVRKSPGDEIMLNIVTQKGGQYVETEVNVVLGSKVK